MNMIIFDDRQGFTLVEIMIVIAIIGVLSAIAIPNFLSYREKSFCSYAESDAANIKSALAGYFSNHDRTSLPSATELKAIEKLALNNDASTISLSTSPTIDDTIVIEVTDSSHRCPHGKKYKSYMGSGQGEWLP